MEIHTKIEEKNGLKPGDAQDVKAGTSESEMMVVAESPKDESMI